MYEVKLNKPLILDSEQLRDFIWYLRSIEHDISISTYHETKSEAEQPRALTEEQIAMTTMKVTPKLNSEVIDKVISLEWRYGLNLKLGDVWYNDMSISSIRNITVTGNHVCYKDNNLSVTDWVNGDAQYTYSPVSGLCYLSHEDIKVAIEPCIDQVRWVYSVFQNKLYLILNKRDAVNNESDYECVHVIEVYSAEKHPVINEILQLMKGSNNASS